jgi:murein DD-endopeptidase MepM/ murein hydrolase activator NlpD
MKNRYLIVSLLLFMLLFTAACNIIGETLAEPDVPILETPPDIEEPVDGTPEPEPEPEPEPPTPPLDFMTDTAQQLIAALSYMQSPIAGRTVSPVNGQLPNAPRSYRNGFHEGLDYYNTTGVTVLSAGPGTVIRADHGYVEMTLEEYDDVLQRSAQASITPPELLDKLRGRQVWIEHPDGVITRYAHLSAIHADITEGIQVTAGQAIATVGNSGMRSNVIGRIESASGEPHLHFEIWYNDSFLGQDRPVNEVRDIYKGILD